MMITVACLALLLATCTVDALVPTSASHGQRGFLIEERPCHLLQEPGGSTLRCDNVTVAYVNENYLRNGRVLGNGSSNPLREVLLERTISSSPKQYLSLGVTTGQSENVEVFKFVNSNVTNEHFDSLFANRRFSALRVLDMSGNRITRLSSAVHLNQNMQQLRVLRMSDNDIENLSADVFQNVDELNQLYLDGNRLTKIVSTGGSNQQQMGEDDERELIFSNLRNLHTMDLSRNRLNDLPRKAFSGLGKLKTLILSGNRLSIVPFQVFKPLLEIELLDLSSNDLRSILENFFIANKRLRVLRLSDNKIDKITMSSFYGLSRLEELQLAGNNLTFIDRNAFDNLEELRILNLRNNQLVQFPTTLFNGLKNLRVLDLSENWYRQLPNGLLSHQLDCLEELYVENNSFLEHLDSNLVSRHNEVGANGKRPSAPEKKLRLLRKVSIRGNPMLLDVERIIFEVMPNVQFLDLSQNQLRQIPKVIGSLKGLKTLRLEENQLTFLPEEVKNLQALESLDLLGNNYACDCRMFWLPLYLKVMRDQQFPEKAHNISRQNPMNQHKEQQEERGVVRDSVENDYDAEDLEYLDKFMDFRRLKCRNAYPGDMVRVLRQLHCAVPVSVARSESQMHLLRSDAILECSFSGNPQPNIIWVTPQNHILRYNPDPDVKPVLMLDSHKYEQKIEFQTLTANVVEDIIEETNKHQKVGTAALSLASFGAATDALGDGINRTGSMMMMQKAAMTIMENGYLKVHNVSRKDSGVYRCYAWNTMGSTHEEIR